MLQAIKNFLKRIFPPPVRTFLREMEELHRLLRDQNEQMRKLFQESMVLQRESMALQQRILQENAALKQQLAQGNENLKQQLTQGNENLKQQLTQGNEGVKQQFALQGETLKHLGEQTAEQTKRLEGAVRQAENAIPNRTVYWGNEFERDVVRANWGDVTELPDYEEKFVKLISGMDGESVKTIIRILSRQKKYLNSEEKRLNLFTRAEQEEIRLLKENFEDEIYKVSDGLFAYRNYLLPVRHFESSVFYYRHGLDEVKTLDRVKGKAILDVGGFIGDSVLVLSELEPSAIYTFEAVPDNFELLKRTVELNGVKGVVAEQMALGAKAGTMTIHEAGSGSTAIERPGLNYKGDVEVPVVTLDEYVSKHPMEIGLIKVDIEGGEPDFLAGAKETICRQKPILLLSIYHNAHDFFELKPLIESWNLGYRFHIHKPIFSSATGETLLIAELPDEADQEAAERLRSDLCGAFRLSDNDVRRERDGKSAEGLGHHPGL